MDRKINFSRPFTTLYILPPRFPRLPRAAFVSLARDRWYYVSCNREFFPFFLRILIGQMIEIIDKMNTEKIVEIDRKWNSKEILI